jgi:MFS family permease
MSKKRFLYLISSFIAGFSLMTVELTASRVIAPFVGSSVYTWTSVIGIILLGLSLGYYLGGFLADKYSAKNWLWFSYLFSSISIIAIPFLMPVGNVIATAPYSLPVVILLITFFLFFIPSVFLGSLSPIILKRYVASFDKIAVGAGTLSALWSVGSIVGTFATGFLFIGYIGSAATLFSIGVILAINGLFFYKGRLQFILSLILAVFSLIILFYFSGPANASAALFSKESNYYQIKVAGGTYEGISDARILFLDFDSHSVESQSGKFLGTYPDIYPLFSVFNKVIKNIFVIGGGSYSLPKYLAQYYPQASVAVAEIDPQVVAVAQKYFNLDNYKIDTKIGDGRVILSSNQAKYDLIFEDAFNSFISLPWHLTTKEFTQEAKSKLTDGGIYAVNFISPAQGDESLFFQSMLKTFREVFPNMYIFTTGGLSYFPENIVLIGINSDAHKDIQKIKQEVFSKINGEWLAENISDGNKYSDSQGIILTDNFAPVEKLMMPVMNEYFNQYAQFYYSFLGIKT